MARHRRRGRSSFRFSRRARSRSRSSGMGNLMSTVFPAIAYGAVRNYAAAYAQPLTSKIPLGNYADEAFFGGLGYLIAKKNWFGMRKLGITMLTVEAASVGNQLAGQFTGSTSTSVQSTGYSFQ